jgi:hypothetical protein
MAEDILLFHSPHRRLEIGAAACAGSYVDNGVSGKFNFWIGHAFAAQIAFSVSGDGFHRKFSLADQIPVAAYGSDTCIYFASGWNCPEQNIQTGISMRNRL